MTVSKAKAALVTALAAAALTALPVTSAHAIDKVRVEHCALFGLEARPDLARIVNNNGFDLHCFANAGTMQLAVYDIDYVWSGNNKVTIGYQQKLGGAKQWVTLAKNSHRNFDSAHKIFEIRIH